MSKNQYLESISSIVSTTKLSLKCLLLTVTILSLLTSISKQSEGDSTQALTNKPSISDMNVLFPICKNKSIFECKEVYYKIKGHNGCFDWNLEDESFIKIKKNLSKQSEKSNCYDSVIVYTKVNSDPKTSVYLYSVDKNTNHKFKTKIGFGYISKLTIFKRFAYLNTGENLELGVIGKDENNNSFSSLEGYSFSWKIVNKKLDNSSMKNNTSVINEESFNTAELLKLSTEDKDLSEYREKVEKLKFSDLVLLHGITTGKVDVYAELNDNSYEIKSAPKEVVIKEDFDLEPPEVWMTPDTDFTFHLTLVLERVVDVQNLISKTYHVSPKITKKFVDPAKFKFYLFNLTNTKCGIVSSKDIVNFRSGSTPCETNLNINDFRLPDYNNAQAIIHVVNPEYLDLGVQELSKSRLELFQSILNSNKSSQKSLLNSLRENEFLDNQIFKFNKKWSLLTGKYYLIKNFFKTNEQSLVFNEIDVVFNTEFAELKDYIEVVATVFNSNIILVKAVKATTDFYNVISKTKKPIDTSVLKNIRIYDSISISKFGLNRFFLPYLENDSQELRLLVSGGSGIYKIASNNNSVIEVKNNILYGKELGVAEITVFDSSLENNFDTIEVEVRKVESIYSLEARQEVEVGSSARITYSSLHNSNFYNKANNLNNNDKGLFVFTNCTSIKFDHDFSLHQNYVSSSNGNTYNYNQQEKEKSKNDMEVKINNYKLDDIIKTLKGEDFRSRLIEEIPKRLLELSLIDQDNFDSRGAFRTISEPSSHTSFINLSNNYLNINYLEYANFGLCGVSSVESKVSGFVTVTRSNIINNTRNISDFIKLSLPFIPALRPDIQFFSALTQRSPSTSDIHNLKMLGRVTFDKAFVQNQIIISPNSRVAVDFSGGILAWNALKSSSETISSYKQILSYKKIINSGTENNGRESQELSETTANSYIKTEFIDIKKLLFSCYYETPFDLIVKLTTFNESSEFLKNPKSTEISLLVSCKYPSYYSMNIEDDYDKPDVLKIPQRRDIMYTRQINSLANIRIYAFDDKLRIFTQHNGTKGNLTKKSEYEEVEYIEEEDSNTNSFEKSLGALYYISKRIMIRNSISRFPVEFVSAYNQVSQSILINAVNQAYLTPREIKLYLHSENFYEFEIINGSGEFILDLTDTSIGVISYDKNVDKRKFRFIPKKLGLVEILLKDKNFSLSEIVSRSTVIVADISKIQIFAPPYLMIGNEIKAVVKVYDKKGVAFSEQQVEKMGLKVRKSAYEDQGLQYLEEDYNKEKDNDLISKTFNKLNQHKVLILNREITSHLVLQGAFEGVQALSVVSNNDIQSNIVHIQVFEKVEVFPPVLLLYPGSEFTLKIIGGPENEKSLNKIFSIADPEIASIGNSTPRVYAKKIGISEVKINFVFKSDENQLYSTEDEREYYSSIKEYKLCEILVPVQVAFPERVEIEGANNRRLYVNSAVRFLASLKLGDRSFTYGIGDIEFSWTVDNPHLAKFNTKTLNNNTNKCGENSNTNSNNNFSNEEARSLAEYSERIGNEYSVGLSATSNQIGSFLVAYNYGAITIKLSTKINYPAPYESHRPNLFITKKMVSVEENVWVDVAEFYDKNPNKSSLYLLPFHIGHELRTHKKEQTVNYKILKSTNAKEDIIDLSRSGYVRTKESSGLVNVLIEKTDRSGLTIPTVLNMFITNYHSIFAQRSYELILMEAGKVKDLKLVLQHESGLLFAEGYDNLGITVVESNPKIAKAEILLNSTHIRISAYKPGETFIIIYLKSTRKIYDVFRVGVESSVSIPAELNLLLGSEVSLFSNDAKKLSYINNLDAQWVSYDPKVVEIRNNSELHAIKEGTAKIALESTDGNRVILSSLVNVSSLNSVKLELGAVPTYITDKKAHKNYQTQYVFPFRYLLTKGYASEKHLSDNQLDKEFSAHEIKMNLSTSCFLDSEHSSLVTVQTSADKKNCIVTVKEQDGSFLVDRTIVLRLEGVARTKSGLFNKESKIEITYHPGYITKTEQIKFLSNADFKHYDIVISKPHQSNDLVITTQSPQLLSLTRVDNKFVVSVYDEVKDEFESEIVITDNTIHESQVIKVSYVKVSSSSVLFFLMMMLLVLFILICLVLWVIGGDEKAPAVRGNDGFTFTDTNLNKAKPNTGRRLFETGRSM